MQKTITLKDFKVFLLKAFLPILALSISFQVSFAQDGGLTKPASAKKDLPTEKPVNLPALKPVVNAQGVVKGQSLRAESGQTATDVPELNRVLQQKIPYIPTGNTFTPNGTSGVTDVCTFNGSLSATDLTLTAGRFFRDGVPSVCGTAKVCPGPFGTGPYYYDTYTMQNLTCASQCVTVNYIANAGAGDVFVAAYNGSFSAANLCTNYMADGGLSSLAGGAAVSFTFTVPANATVVFVAMAAQIATECPSYTMTVTGINCTPPPACVPATSSILSQVQIPTGTSTLINEQFDGTIPPTGWNVLNNSSPIGVTGWTQGGPLGVFPSQSGAGFMSANFNNTAGTGTISNWTFAPAVTLKNGDKFSFYTRTTTGAFPDRLQLRMSTNGASVNVGTTATSVGDYTNLLLDINPTYTATGYPTAWTQFTVTMSGLPAAGVSGRLAFRYFVENGGPAGANSDFIGIDNAVYTTTTFGFPVTCTGSTANLKVDISGGNGAAYNLILNAAPGGNFAVNNYVSGSSIPVTPAASTTYTLVSVIQADNACCVGSGNTGTVTITPSAATTQPLLITAAPSTTLCAGSPTLLTVSGAPITGTSVTASGAISVAIPDNNATGIGTNLTVAGIPATATATGVGVLFNITHTWDGDLTLFLKSPNGQVLNLVNGKGGSGDNFVNTNVTSTATVAFPTTGGTPFTGTFRPDGSLTALAPTGFTPTAATFTPLFATNGVWSFGARDAAAGDAGTITNWTLTINYAIAAGPLPGGYTYAWAPPAGLSNTTQFQVAASPMTTTTYTVMGTAPGGCQTTTSYTVNINQLPAVTTNPSNITVCDGAAATFTSVGTGAGATYQWQLSTNGGTSWANITNGAPYSGVTTGTLVVSPTTGFMNGYRYRMVVSGTCPPSANSTGAILTVNPLPVIAISPVSPVCGGVAGINGTLLTAGSSAPPIPGSVTVSSGTISVPVPDNTANGANTTLTVAGVPANATITGARVALNMTHTWNGDMLFNLKAPNGTVLALDKYLTGTGGASATTGFVNTVISSAGTTALSAGTGTYTGTFKPDLINGTITGATVQNPTGFVSTATAFSDLYSTPNGVWTLAMADGGGGDVGTLTSWSVVLDYTTPGGAGSPLTYTWSPAAGLYSNVTATTPYIAGTQTGTVYAAPAVNTVYTITGTNGTTGCVNTGNITVVYTPAVPTVVPASAAVCNPGGATQKLSILAATPINATFSTGTISVTVPDNNVAGATSNLNVPVPANAIISNMTVTYNMSHTWAGDVVVALKAPNGAILNLNHFLSTTGGTGATTGFVNTKISSSATASLGAAANPFSGTYRADAKIGTGPAPFGPSGPTGFAATVGSFSGLYSVPNGTWTLAMYDGFGGDVGILSSWSIDMTYTAGNPPPTNGVWTPIAGLFLDSLKTIPYVAGTPAQTVWAFPATTTSYSVSVSSIGPDATQIFTNPAGITINDFANASPYPAAIAVSGLPTTGATVKSVTITGISHTWSDDIDVVLQSPTGTNVVLMSDVGSLGSLSNVTYKFSDAGSAMSITAGNPSGTYKPTNNGATDNFAAPGPGSVTDASPALSNFTGNPNGTWKLFIVDDVAGDNGSISGGYNIEFSYPTAGCTSAPRIVPITVNVPVSITTQPVNAAVCTDKVTSFTVVAAGTAPSHNWQVSTDVGNTFTNINNGGVYAGVKTATLTITAPPLSMSGYVFRDSVAGAAPCSFVYSNRVSLTVNPLPTVVISASPYTKLFPGLRTTLFSTVTPTAATYTWLRNGLAVTGSASSLIVGIDGLGDYTLRVTDVNGCSNTSNMVSLTDSISGKVFVYPNPNSGQFQVRYYSIINNTGLPRGINVFDARGKKISTLNYSISAPYARMDVDLRNHGTGVYWLEVVDVNGNRLAMGRAEVLR